MDDRCADQVRQELNFDMLSTASSRVWNRVEIDRSSLLHSGLKRFNFLVPPKGNLNQLNPGNPKGLGLAFIPQVTSRELRELDEMEERDLAIGVPCQKTVLKNNAGGPDTQRRDEGMEPKRVG